MRVHLVPKRFNLLPLPGLLALFQVAATLILVPSAHAVLGEREHTIESDRSAVSGTVSRSQSRREYTVHEIDSPAGKIREFVSSSGVIFGVAWNGGMSHPDLKSLLGTYAADYQQARAQNARKQGRRASSAVRTSRVVVETSGHMRDLRGRAFDPSLIPTGVSADEIK